MSKLLEASWLLLIFFLPLYFNPAGYQAYYFAKSLLLIFMVSIMLGLAVASWLLKKKEIKPGAFVQWLKQSPLQMSVLIFGAIYAISTALSIQPGLSLWGNLADKNGLVPVLAWVILFVILAQNVNSDAQIRRILYTVNWSAGFMSLIGIMQHFMPGILPWFDFGTRVFSTAGNPLSLSAFISMCLPLTAALICMNWSHDRSLWRPLNWTVLALVIVLIVDIVCLWYAQYSITWMMFVVGGIVFVFLYGLFLRNRFALVSGAIVIVLVAIVAGLLVGQLVNKGISVPSAGSSTDESTYAQQMGLRTLVKRPLIWKSAIDVIVDSPDIPFSQDNLHGMRRLIGYGPDTFIITSQLKYPGLLKSIDTYRSMLLSQPENHYLFLAATTGILGWLSYLIILVIAVFSGLKIARVSTDRSTVIAVAALLAAVVQYCAHILFSPANIVPDMVFWIALSLLAVLYRLSLFKENEDKSISVIPTSVSTTRKAVATGILAVGFIVAVGLTAGPFLADIKLQQALNTWSKEKYAALARFTEATKLDRYEATYYGYLGYHTYQLAIQNTNSEEKIRLLNISLAAYDAADHLEPHLAYWHYTPADVNTYWASIGERNRWKDALYLYENANALFPGNAVILNKWALALILFGDYEEAEMKLEQSRVSDPEWDQTVYIDGFLQAETGDMQEAGSVIVNRAKSKPDSIRYFVSLCHQLAIYGKIGPVSESISNYLQIQGDEWTVYALLGIAEFYGRDIESAGSNLLKCAEVAPKEQYKLLTDLVTFLSIEDPQFNISARQIINILTGGSR